MFVAHDPRRACAQARLATPPHPARGDGPVAIDSCRKTHRPGFGRTWTEGRAGFSGAITRSIGKLGEIERAPPTYGAGLGRSRAGAQEWDSPLPAGQIVKSRAVDPPGEAAYR